MLQGKAPNIGNADVGENAEQQKAEDGSHYDDCKRELRFLLPLRFSPAPSCPGRLTGCQMFEQLPGLRQPGAAVEVLDEVGAGIFAQLSDPLRVSGEL